MNRLHKKFKEEVIPEMMKQFEYKNVNQVPKLAKISLNMSVGEATENKALLDNAVKEMIQISGRKPIITKAKKSISNFKLREGMPIGCKVTLRREIMYEFLDRLISIYIPRVRDFRGVSPKAFDGRGNYTLGIKEQTIFPEIDYDNIDALRGLGISIITTAETDDVARELLRKLGLPFKK